MSRNEDERNKTAGKTLQDKQVNARAFLNKLISITYITTNKQKCKREYILQ